MIKIHQNTKKTKQNKKFLGKNLVLLPKIFSSIFTNPKYTSASLDMLVLLAQNSIDENTLQLPRSYHPSYIKNTVVPFLATLRIKETAEKAPVFSRIQYNKGQASISYQFSNYIKTAFTNKKSYIIVNVDEFLSLKGLYTKQLYLSLCAWQKGQSLDIYRTGSKSIFKHWQLPKSYEKCLIAKILKPSLNKINALTNLHIIKIACYASKYRLIYKRLSKADKKKSDLSVIIDRYPHVRRRLPSYGSTTFSYRTPWKATKNPTTMPTALAQTEKEYCESLVKAGVEQRIAKNITQKKYELSNRYFAFRGDWKPPYRL